VDFSQHLFLPCMGGLQIPRWLGSDPLSAWWLGLAPDTLEFWVRFPNERNQGKQAHPVLKYRVPHGSHPANSFVIGPAVINTHSMLRFISMLRIIRSILLGHRSARLLD
jgi:hypothetical protein